MKPFRGIMLNNSHPLARGPVGLWLFDEGVGDKVYDLSGNGNIGTLLADTHWVPGKFGSALSFDGTEDYVNIPGNPILRPSGDFTFSVWFNSSTLDSYNGVMTEMETVSFGGAAIITGTTNKIAFFVGDGLGGWTYIKTSWTPSINTWYHAVGVHQGTNNILYVNGVYQAQGVRAVSFSVQNLHIGRFYTNSVGIAFKGLISLSMIFNRGLSASEAAWLYQEPFSMFEQAIIPFLIPAVPAVSPNLTDRNNYNGYTAFIQQYIKHKVNGTDPWANPQGDLL